MEIETTIKIKKRNGHFSLLMGVNRYGISGWSNMEFHYIETGEKALLKSIEKLKEIYIKE